MSFGVRLAMVGVVSVATSMVCPQVTVAGAVGLSLAMAAVGLSGVVPRRLGRLRVMALVWWMAFGLAAMAYGARARDCALEPDLGWMATAEAPVVLEGRLRRDAAPGASGVQLDLTLTRVLVNHQWRAVSVRALGVVKGELAIADIGDWTAGRIVRVPGTLRRPTVVRNPGSPSVRWQRLTQPYQLLASIKSGLLVTVRKAPPWDEAAAAVRAYVRRIAERWLAPLGEQTRAVVVAILIGDRAGLDDDVVRHLQMAGTFHVVAISGGNVAILTAICFFTLRWLTRSERGPTLLTLAVVLSYGGVVGAEPSVTRAVLAATVYSSLRLTALVPRAVNVIAVTAVGCLVMDPLVVVNVGAWLSFGATLGLLLILPKLLGERRDAGWVWRSLRGLFLATCAAELVVTPIAAVVFTRVGVAGLLLNFVAIPAMTVVQLSGIALCVVAPWWPAGASTLATIAHVGTDLLLGSASAMTLAPWSSWRVPAPPVAWVWAYYGLVVACVMWRGRRWVTRSIVLAAAICGGVIVMAPWVAVRLPASGWLRLTMLDVGQGDALVLQLPDGRTALVDAGGANGTFDVGGRVVTPALLALGARRPDWVVVTHGDVDHVGGAQRVIEDLGGSEVWEGVAVPYHPPLLALRRAVHERGMVWRRLRQGDQIEIGPVELQVRHPPVPDWERRRVRNDDSLVLQVRFGRIELLLTGDAGAEFERAYRPENARPPIRVLKVAHHGSVSSTSAAFLREYRPAIALVSVGQHNLFGHPSRVIVNRLKAAHVPLFRTDQDGAIILDTDGRELRVKTMTGQTMTVVAHGGAG